MVDLDVIGYRWIFLLVSFKFNIFLGLEIGKIMMMKIVY